MQTWRPSRSAVHAAVILALALVWAAACARSARPPTVMPLEGSVAGRIVGGGSAGDPIVVYLEPLEPPRRPPLGRRSFQVRHRSGQLEPEFLVARVGDRVVFRNDDEIFHNVFSSSATQRFDLGVLKRGEHRTLELSAPGAIPLYSALHEDVSGMIFVAPSDHYTVVEGDRYQLRAVPAGRFRLRVWSETQRARPREVVISAGQKLRLDLRLEEDG